jgi:hypothetical protein
VADLRGYCLALYSKECDEWARADLSGADYLRLQICKTTNAFDRRLLMLERIRATEPSMLADLHSVVEQPALAPLP